MNPLITPPSSTAPADEDLAEQAVPCHGIPSQDPNPAAQVALEPQDAEREANSVLMGGGMVAGVATGATIGVMVAGPVGVVVGAALGAVAGALGGAAAGVTANPEDSGSADSAPADITHNETVMGKNLIANATTSIQGTTSEVWKALVTPAAIKQYMFGANIESDWRSGSEIKWKGEMKGEKYEDKGVILKFEPEHTLQYSHFSPLSGQPDDAENYHTVTIRLAGMGNHTEVSLSQDNNLDERTCKESQKNWEMMLEGLKKYVEGAA